MKHLSLATILLPLICMLSACCTKMACLDMFNEIHLVNFRPEDADSITILTYPKSSSSAHYIDSFFTSAHSQGGFDDSTLIIFLPEDLKRDMDYRVNIISTGESYAITGFEFEKKTCNKCFPYHPESDYHDVLQGYFVNGQRKEDMSIIIHK